VETYVEAIHRLHEYLLGAGMPTTIEGTRREHVEAFVADQLARLKPSSARSRYASLRQFFRWCVDEGEITESPMARMRPPAVPEQPVPVLSEEGLLVDVTQAGSRSISER
jgi:site-specific recombinase XerD